MCRAFAKRMGKGQRKHGKTGQARARIWPAADLGNICFLSPTELAGRPWPTGAATGCQGIHPGAGQLRPLDAPWTVKLSSESPRELCEFQVFQRASLARRGARGHSLSFIRLCRNPGIEIPSDTAADPSSSVPLKQGFGSPLAPAGNPLGQWNRARLAQFPIGGPVPGQQPIGSRSAVPRKHPAKLPCNMEIDSRCRAQAWRDRGDLIGPFLACSRISAAALRAPSCSSFRFRETRRTKARRSKKREGELERA